VVALTRAHRRAAFRSRGRPWAPAVPAPPRPFVARARPAPPVLAVSYERTPEGSKGRLSRSW
jgi:hypothetical protein